MQANREPLGSVLRSLAQSAIGGAKIGISVVAKDGALRISADGAGGRPAYHDSESGDRLMMKRGAVKTASGQMAADCSIVIRMRSGILVFHSDALGRFSVPMSASDRMSLSMIVRSADGSQMAVQEFPWLNWLRQEAAAIEVTLDRVKTISVLVSDSSGAPVPHAHAAIAEIQNGYSRLDRMALSGYTDDSGKFTVRLPEKFQIGFVYAFKSGAGLDYRSYVAPRDNGDLHAKTPPQPEGLVRLALAGSLRVTIKCIDESGKPVAGLLVAPTCFNFTKQGETSVLGPNPWYVVTNDRGEAIFDWIPTWQQDVVRFEASPRAGRPDEIERVKFDPKKPTDQFAVTIFRKVGLSGMVRDAAGKPVAGAEIDLSGRGYGQRRFQGRTKSDDRGQYQFEVRPLEVYMLAASMDDRHQASAVRDGIAVYPQKPLAGIDLTLVPTTRVFGKVAVGPDNKPGGHFRVSISSSERGSRVQDFNFPHDHGEYLGWAAVTQFDQTDDRGRFEFRLAPGQYELSAGQIEDGPILRIRGETDRVIVINDRQIVITGGEKELEVNLHGDLPPKFGVLHGTVVNGSKPVPGALIDGASQPGPNFNAVADDHGAFDISVPDAPAVVFAKSKDGSLAGVVRAGAGERNITVPIAPTATCAMRLLHKDQKPYSSDRTVEYGVQIPMDPSDRRSGGHEASGGKVHPDRDGRLLLPGMVVGETYEIWLQDIDSRSDYRRLTTIRPQTPGDQSLPDITHDDPTPYNAPTLDERISQAFDRPVSAVQRNRDAKDYARLADARVLITFADPQSPLTKKLFALYFDGDVSAAAYGNFRTLATPTSAAKFAEATALAKELGIELSQEITPLIVAEGADGKVLGLLKRSDLITKKYEIDQDALLAFVTKHVPARLDGQKLFDDALAQAKRENKRVLADETAVWCGPCHMLASFLDKNRTIWEKDYVWVKMDLRWPHATDIMNSLRGDADGGVPWFAILDANGKVLATSNKSEGANIGFPSQPDEIAQFMQMIKTTAQRMTEEDLVGLKKALEGAKH
jgi:hypothetical protein